MERRPRSEWRRLLPGLVAVLAILTPSSAQAEVRWLLEGLADMATVDTGRGSRAFERNQGHAAADTTVRLWAVAEPHARVRFVALGEFEGATDEAGVESTLETALVRIMLRRNEKLLLEVGRMISPVGSFAARSLPTSNPLIGEPTSYTTSYPVGVSLAGSASLFDFRASIVDEPMINEGFVPDWGRALRPTLAIGVTPMTGLRLGAYAIKGPYLDSEMEAHLDPGVDLEQSVRALEIQYSVGHLEVYGEWGVAFYDLPPSGRHERGRVWYVEPKLTWTPRLYSAVRYERNNYLRIAWDAASTVWRIRDVTFGMLEVATGYRVTPETLVKAAVRTNHWSVPSALASTFPDDHAVMLQVSYRFDVLGWLTPLR